MIDYERVGQLTIEYGELREEFRRKNKRLQAATKAIHDAYVLLDLAVKNKISDYDVVLEDYPTAQELNENLQRMSEIARRTREIDKSIAELRR